MVPTQSGDISDPADVGEPAGARGVVARDPRVHPRVRPAHHALPRRRRRSRRPSAPGPARCAAPTRRPPSRRSARRARRSWTATRPTAGSASAARWPAWRSSGARVLLLGAGYDACTTFHLAEYRIPVPEVENSFAVMTPQGRRWDDGDARPRSPRSASTSSARDFERDRPVVRGTVGAADGPALPAGGRRRVRGAVAGAAPLAAGVGARVAAEPLPRPSGARARPRLPGPCEASPSSRSRPGQAVRHQDRGGRPRPDRPRAAPSPPSSAPTARARPPRSRPARATAGRTPARSASSGLDPVARGRARCAPASA